MRSEWILEYQDYVAAQKLFNRGSLWRRTYIFFLTWLLPAFALFLVVVSVAGILINPEKNDWRGLLNIWPFIVFVTLYRFSFWLTMRRNYKRIFLNGDPTKPVYMDIDDDRIISGLPGSSEGKFFWPTILRFAENEKIAILYISKRLFLMIPKNKLADETWREMKSLIITHVSGAK